MASQKYQIFVHVLYEILISSPLYSICSGFFPLHCALICFPFMQYAWALFNMASVYKYFYRCNANGILVGYPMPQKISKVWACFQYFRSKNRFPRLPLSCCFVQSLSKSLIWRIYIYLDLDLDSRSRYLETTLICVCRSRSSNLRDCEW